MVLAVGDAPRVVGHQEGGVQNPSYPVVDGLGLAESLVATCKQEIVVSAFMDGGVWRERGRQGEQRTFMGQDPDASEDKTLEPP